MMNIKDKACRCDSCYYYEKLNLFKQGLCKFNAPSTCDKMWPKVNSGNWCGKWVRFVTREEMDNYKGKA